MTTAVYLLIMTAVVIAGSVGVHRRPGWSRCAVALLITVVSAALVAILMGRFFTAARLLVYGWFVHVPALLVVFAILTRKSSRLLATCSAAAAVLLAALGVYALRIEPYRLEVNHVGIRSSKVDRPWHIAVIADLQTDVIGSYERMALRRVMDLRPDIILLAGDYLQTDDPAKRTQLSNELHDYLEEIDFHAPQGIYAVGGNTDNFAWWRIFEGLPVHIFRQTDSVELEQLQITGLSLASSFHERLRIGPAKKFHVVVGHSPDFALGDVDADLLIAGHTHGGQVRLPWIGPLITFSSVPRKWGAGVTDLGGGRSLIVSRGIGMERGEAPRLRFLCRPELVVIDVTPPP